ncbi:MAG: OmpH family outer membrane protein [Acidobacteriota bacterium]|nr:OmpH family outer membrane protein [Acidobacteriota bacterium]
MTVIGAALAAVLSAGPVFAQGTPPPTNPPAQPPTNPPAQPPATPPATAPQTPVPQNPPQAAQPPRPFPVGAKIALINLQAVASTSNEGKAASAKIQAFNTKKTAELTEKGKQAQALQTKLQQGGSVMSDAARGQAEKELQKLQRELTGLQEDAQQELQELQNSLQLEFQGRIAPIIEQVAMEKELHAVLGVEAVVWGTSAIDITAEVIKRLDSAPKPAPKK